MTELHINRNDAESYVLGAMSSEDARALERHASDCAQCSLLLQREAALEEQLYDIARALPRRLRAGAPIRSRRRWTAVAAMAAAVAFAVMLFPRKTEVTKLPTLGHGFSPDRLVICPASVNPQACARDARQRGLMVRDPNGANQVPRYEGTAQLPEPANSSPVSL